MSKIYGFEPVLSRPHPHGRQHMYRFPSGYGASVIPGHYDDELVLAVIRWDPAVEDGWEFVNGTDVTRGDFPDVRVGPEHVPGLLTRIAAYTTEAVEEMQRRYMPWKYEEDDR